MSVNKLNLYIAKEYAKTLAFITIIIEVKARKVSDEAKFSKGKQKYLNN